MKRIIKKLSFCLTAIILMAACTNNDDSESQEVSIETNDFDDNTPVIDTKWYDGPNYPFVGTVNKVDAEKDEVEVSIYLLRGFTK